MGRKTYESIGRPLPNRINYIVSNTIKDLDGASIFKSTEDALESAKEICNKNQNYDEIVIIGGGYLFRDTLSITNKLVLTNVDCDIEYKAFRLFYLPQMKPAILLSIMIVFFNRGCKYVHSIH